MSWVFVMAAVVHAEPRRGAVSPAPPPRVAAHVQDETESLEEARRQLRDGTAGLGVLSVQASKLIDAGDLATLREFLAAGDPHVVLAILEAFQAVSDDRLLSEVIGVAARDLSPEVTAAATRHLSRLVSRPAVVSELIVRLDDSMLERSHRVVIIDALGRSRSLAAVPRLIEALDERPADGARRALERLLGFDLGADPAAWEAAWEEWRGLSRDEILDRAIERYQGELDAMVREVVTSRLDRMALVPERLVEGLGDEYAEVRLEAARRLAENPNLPGAAAALPVLKRRLGLAEGDDVVTESSAEVRAALVRALGVLGRDTPEVVSLLVRQLGAFDPRVAEAAARALGPIRGRPDIVKPLLDYLDRSNGDEEHLVEVLLTVAQNEPSDEFPRLAARLRTTRSARVRAALWRALLAGGDLAAVLSVDGGVPLSDEQDVVRYAIAVGLGSALGSLAPDAPERELIAQWLAQLLEDEDGSVRAEAALALGACGGPSVLGWLEARSTREPNPDVMARLVEAVGRLGSPDGVALVGRILTQRVGSRTEALQDVAERAVESIVAGGDASLWSRTAEQLAEVGDFRTAAWAFRQTMERFDGLETAAEIVDRARGRRAEMLWYDGRYESALAEFEQLHEAEAAYPSSTTRLRYMARVHEQLGRPSAAADRFLEILAVVPSGDRGRLTALQDVVRTLHAAERYDEQLPFTEELVRLDEDNDELLHQLARTYGRVGQTQEALDAYARLLERVPAERDDWRAQLETERTELSDVASEGADAPLEEGVESPAEPPPAAPADDGVDSTVGEAEDEDAARTTRR